MNPTTNKKRHISSNGFVFLAAIANVINLALYIEEGLAQAIKLEIVGMAFLALCVFLNIIGKYGYSKTVSLIAVNGQMFMLSKLLGISSCNYLYLFPYIISMLFFLRGSNYGLRSYLPAVITIANLCAILFFCSYEATVVLPHYHFIAHVSVNIIINFFLIVLFCYLVFRNIRNREKKLQESNALLEKALEVKSRFLSSMSHELRTPLNGIIGSLDIVETENPNASKDEYFQILRYSSSHMLSIVNQILEYSKFESKGVQLIYEKVKVREILSSLTLFFQVDAQKNGINFLLHVADDFPHTIIADKVRLEQVLINCISNAIKFSTGGSIVISVNANVLSEQEKIVAIDVSDEGVGIKKEMLETVFESFVQEDVNTTRRFGGTGLGLSICKQIMTAMNGSIALIQNEPVGTIVQLRFPTTIMDQTETTVENGSSIIKLKDLRVLLVEDNSINRKVAEGILKTWGCQVTQAINGVEGLKKFKEANFDIGLIDLEMPEMDGRKLTNEIKRLQPHFPCIAFSAATYDNVWEELQTFGFDDFVPKPFNPKDLNAKILTQITNRKK